MDFLTQGITQAFGLLLSGDAETFAAIRATLLVSAVGLSAALVIGIPAGFCLGFFRFPGRGAARLLVETLLSLPTVVIGLMVFALLSRQGPLGGFGLLFTLPAVGIGLTILALPIVAALSAGAVENLDPTFSETALTLGASRFQLILASLRETRYALFLAGVTAFGRIVSEVGIAMMVGGNIKWHTRTITTAIALETGKGDFARGIALGVVLMVLAFMVTATATFLKRRAG